MWATRCRSCSARTPRPKKRDALRAALGLDQPFFVQFWHFLGNAVQGEFGICLRLARTVSDLIAERFAGHAGTGPRRRRAGAGRSACRWASMRRSRGTFLSQVFMTFSLLGVSLPTFLIGILLILVFAVWLGWLPTFGRGDVVRLGWWTTGFLTARAAPGAARDHAGLFQLTLIMRLVRAEMLEVLRTDYIKFARARGLTEPRRAFRPCAEEHPGAGDHHHRPAAGRPDRLRHHHRDGVPVAGHGAAVHPGGQLRRHPGHGGLPVLIALIFVVINLMVDLLYYAVDPRLRDRGAAGGH